MKELLCAKSVGARPLVRLKPIFLADAMLGSVARKLRIFGFDTLYIKDIHDDDVLKIGIAQNRIILTCDKELFKRIVKVGASGVLLEGSNDLEDIVHILSKQGVYSISFDTMNSRCSTCNGVLSKENYEQIRKYVHPNVIKWHKDFFRCENCYKIYWEGSHISGIRSLARNLEIKIKEKFAEKDMTKTNSHDY